MQNIRDNTLQTEEKDANEDEDYQERYRKQTHNQLLEKAIAKPVFIVSQFITALGHHIMYHTFGLLYSLLLLACKGKVCTMNYGFLPGVFNTAFVTTQLLYFTYMTLLWFLIKETYFMPDLAEEEKKMELYPFILFVIFLFFRQCVICVRHGCTPEYLFNA